MNSRPVICLIITFLIHQDGSNVIVILKSVQSILNLIIKLRCNELTPIISVLNNHNNIVPFSTDKTYLL